MLTASHFGPSDVNPKPFYPGNDRSNDPSILPHAALSAYILARVSMYVCVSACVFNAFRVCAYIVYIAICCPHMIFHSIHELEMTK